MAKIKDSGSRREFESGAVRDICEGKGRCDLLPLSRRITGYLTGTLDKWGASKRAEEKDRKKHSIKGLEGLK